MKTSLTLILTILFFSITKNCLANTPIIPDGSTGTIVSNEEGRINVSIAPPDPDRVSINNYSRFNVPASGVSLDNTDAAARTIVNDVTGNESSLIAGELEVVGTRAHVIVANRNGITVSGGRFINNADLILTTGSVGRVERTISNGVTQNNITLDAQGGEIVIGEGGLSGALNTLDIIANSIKVKGAVSNTNPGLRNITRVFPGKSKSELDVSLSPSNPVRSMATVKQSNESSQEGAMLFDISQKGSISSGSISIAVTQDGAGFRQAGSLNALSGDINIAVNGLLDIDGGNIVAQRHVKLNSKNVVFSKREVDGVVSQAVVQAKTGAVVINAKEKFTNNGAVIRGFERDSKDEFSKGAVTIKANEVINKSQDINALSVLFGENDDLVVNATKGLENNTGRLVSNNKIILDVGYLNNHIDIANFDGRGEWNVSNYSGKRLWYTLFLKKQDIRDRSVDYGTDRLQGQLAFISGENGIQIQADKVLNDGGEINANNGNIDINTKVLTNISERTGKLHLVRECGLRCTSYGSSSITTLGGNINAGNEINIRASNSVSNTGGQIFAINDLNINSPSIKTSSFKVHNVVSRDRGLSGLNLDKAFIFSRDQGGSFISNFGNINLTTLQATDVDGGFIEASNGEVIGEVNIVREPEEEKATFGEHIGHFDWLLN